MRKHVTPSLIVSFVALFVALSGSGYAAVQLHKNSVTSATIRNGSIRMQDLNASIRPQKANARFRSAVVSTVTDPASGLLINVQSEPGVVGPAGTPGPQGATGPATVTTRDAFGPTVGAGQHTGAHAACQPGERVVGGGARFEGAPQEAFMQSSTPETDGWNADYLTSSSAGATGRAHVFVLCAA